MEILKVKKLNIVYKKKPKDLFFHFKEKFKDCRFDGIAGAVQVFLELNLVKWMNSCMKILKSKNIYCRFPTALYNHPCCYCLISLLIHKNKTSRNTITLVTVSH